MRQPSIWIQCYRWILATYPSTGPPSAEHCAGNAVRATVLLHGLAPGGVCQVGLSPARRCALTAPFHPYPDESRRYVFCCTFRRLSTPGSYPAPCPTEFGLSSPARSRGDCPTGMRPVWVSVSFPARFPLRREFDRSVRK